MIRLAGPGGSAAHYALATLQNLKDYMKDSGTANDTVYNFVLDGIHRSVHAHLGGQFIKDTGVEYDMLLDGRGGDELHLPYYPIVSVTAIEWVRVLGNTVFESYRSYATTEYQLDAANGILQSTGFGFWPYGRNVLRVRWRAGFTTCPADVLDAVLQWAATRSRRAIDARHDLLSSSHETDSVQYTRDDMPTSVHQVLLNYRLVEATV